ncbi:hypothetical protein BD289DRAFT_139730 [Coniella lustricola]|uniref:Uncharacterized protein n=1 Tax=Coniella lustricola TaxID=2025994 RepID=A0A2T3AF72_9PEZI|nr:hypothetical protein BD289DRAFT_139730 [Coniella lustricola]
MFPPIHIDLCSFPAQLPPNSSHHPVGHSSCSVQVSQLERVGLYQKQQTVPAAPADVRFDVHGTQQADDDENLYDYTNGVAQSLHSLAPLRSYALLLGALLVFLNRPSLGRICRQRLPAAILRLLRLLCSTTAARTCRRAEPEEAQPLSPPTTTPRSAHKQR